MISSGLLRQSFFKPPAPKMSENVNRRELTRGGGKLYYYCLSRAKKCLLRQAITIGKKRYKGREKKVENQEQTKGLTTQEALERAKNGRNVLTQGKKKSMLAIVLGQFASPLRILLIVAAGISIATGELVDGIIIIVVVRANVIIGTVQEVSAEKSVEALKQINASTAVVIRDGAEKEIPAADLVVGDYVILEAGRVVPADLHLTGTSSLKVNESALTGESVAVEKDHREKSDEKTPLADRKDKAYMSTLVEYGRGEGVAEKIGDDTEIGELSRMRDQITKQETPLQ